MNEMVCVLCGQADEPTRICPNCNETTVFVSPARREEIYEGKP